MAPVVLVAVLALTVSGLVGQGASADTSAPEGWGTFSPREETRPEFSYKQKGGPAGKGSFVIRNGKLEGLDGHWAT